MEAFFIQVILCGRRPFKGFHLLMELLCTRLLAVTDGIDKLVFCYVCLYSFKLYFMLGAGACHGLLFAVLMLNVCDLCL